MCEHKQAARVRLAFTGELVACICEACYEQLPADYIARQRVEAELEAHRIAEERAEAELRAGLREKRRRAEAELRARCTHDRRVELIDFGQASVETMCTLCGDIEIR